MFVKNQRSTQLGQGLVCIHPSRVLLVRLSERPRNLISRLTGCVMAPVSTVHIYPDFREAVKTDDSQASASEGRS